MLDRAPRLPQPSSQRRASRPLPAVRRRPSPPEVAVMLALPFPQIDPALFTLEVAGMEFSLRWYALAYIAGLVLGWRLCVWLMRRPRLWPSEKAPMTPEQPEELLTWMVLGVVLGGRLGFVLFYNPAHFIQNPAEIIAIWEGGMSFHGGFLGV
ncbi:MAG: prolipoprotein diacylglyceryl transferase, partial [Pseudomonadota bacterium]